MKINKGQLIAIWITLICLCPLIANATNTAPFLGHTYKNIKWTTHIPSTTESDAEEGYTGQIDKGILDLEGDGKKETIKVIWGAGVSDHSLTIEFYKDNKKFATLKPKGIQPNFKVEDIDNDGKLEVVLWGAVADPNMSQIDDGSKPFEGHSDLHLFKVDVYKLEKGTYRLQKSYVSKQKYEPFCEKHPI